MHAVHPDSLPLEKWEGLPFRTLLSQEAGGRLGAYLLTVTESNCHVHDREDQIYIIVEGRGLMAIEEETQEIGPGWLVHIPRGKRHSLAPIDGPVTVYSFEYET